MTTYINAVTFNYISKREVIYQGRVPFACPQPWWSYHKNVGFILNDQTTSKKRFELYVNPHYDDNANGADQADSVQFISNYKDNA